MLAPCTSQPRWAWPTLLGADEVLDAATIAARIGCDPGAVGRLLRALHAHGLFTRNDGGGWRHNAASAVLRSDHPQSVRDYARMFASPLMWGCITELGHSVRTGEPAANLFDPNGTWAYLAAHPDEAAIFNTAMTAKSHADAAEVVASLDLTGAGTVVDIGGGRGQLLHAILDASPSATGILFDLPDVTAQAIPRHDDRIHLHPGDFFTDPIPPYDTAVLMTVIHDWPDAEAIDILRAARAAARPASRLLIIDSLVDDDAPNSLRHRCRHRHARHHRRTRTHQPPARRPPHDSRVHAHCHHIAPIRPRHHRSAAV